MAYDDEGPPSNMLVDPSEIGRGGWSYEPPGQNEAPPSHMVMSAEDADRGGYRLKPEPPPEAEGVLATGAREFAHGVLPSAVGAGTGILAATGAGALAGSFFPGVGTLAGGLAGAAIGGIAGGIGAEAVQERVLKAAGVDDAVQRAVNAKTNPWASAAGSGLSAVAGFGAGAVGAGQRALGAAIGGGVEAGVQLYHGELDPAKLAGSTLSGAVFAKPYSWGERLGAQGELAGRRAAELYHGSSAPKSTIGASESPAGPQSRRDDIGDPQNKPTEAATQGYSKEPSASGPSDNPTVNVGNIDPTLQHALDAANPRPAPAGEMQGPQQPYGPPELQGPRQPYGLPEMQGPRAPPPTVAEPPQGQAAAPTVEPPTGPTKRPQKAVDPNSLNALDYLTTQGGLKADEFGELASIRGGGGNYNYPQGGALFRKEGGMTLDQARQKLVDAGFINDEGARHSDRPSTSTVNDVLDIVSNGLGGKHTYTLGNEGRQSTAQKARLSDENLEHTYRQVDDFIDETGANPAFREPMVKLMQKEGIDVDTAHDRMMEVNVPPQWEAGAEGKPQAVLPGFEQAGQGEMAQRGADKALRPGAAQKPMDEGMFGDTAAQQDLMARRDVIERGRSGRPIKTGELPIGSEQQILEKGLEKVETTPRPEVDAPPVTEAMARKGMTKAEMAEAAKLAEGVPVTKVEPSRRLQGKKLTAADLQKEGQSPINKAEAPPATTPKSETLKPKEDYYAGLVARTQDRVGMTKAEKAAANAEPAVAQPKTEADQHSRAMESTLDTIERAVEGGNRGDVLKAAKAARDTLAGVPKEVIKADPEYWAGFKKTISDMSKKGYETATQEQARTGNKDAQKILDTGVDETFKGGKPDPVEAASDKILKDMGITPTETGGKRAEPELAGVKPEVKGVASSTEAVRTKGEYRIEPDHAKPGEWVVKKGDEVISEHKLLGPAYVALNKAAKGAPGTPAELSPTGGQAAPPANVGAAVQQGGGGGGRPPTPGGGPAAPPPGPPQQPNMAHTPPQQRGWLSELWRDVQRKVGAHMLGPEGMEARRLIRGAYGENKRVAEQTAYLLKNHEETVRAMNPADRAALINQMQGDNRFPNFQPTPEQKALMRDNERAMQEWEAKLHQLPDEYQIAFRDHYMAQMYENPNAAPDLFAGAGKRGGAGSTKHRKYATYEEAKDAGLTPITDDPIEISTRYINSIKDFVASRQVMERAELGGTVGYFKSAQNIGAAGGPQPLVVGGPPPGWKKLDTPGKGGKDAYAPADFADTFNNFYGKGFGQSDKSRNAYEALRNSTNAWTQLELGINAYHMFTMANEAIISDVASGINKMAAGNVRGGLKTIAAAPLAGIPGQRFGEAIERNLGVTTRYLEGKRFQNEYLDPNSTNPIATILAEANARPIGRGHAADYTFQDRGSFINKFDRHSIQSELNNAWKDIKGDFANAPGVGDKGMAALRNAGRALQTVSAPIFDKYIPALKAGAVHSQMKDWHEAMVKQNPAFDMINSPTDRRVAVDAAMKIVDSVDNRFGEMIHDNMFMNATLKQSAQVAMRSFSWAIGAMKEIGGGTAATGKALYKLAETKGANNRFDMTNPEWDPRMSYAIAFPFVLATISSVYQMLRAGEAPEGWRDLYAPKTGGTVPGVGGRGQVPEHVLMPGYQKDVLGWTHHPLQEAYNKLGGLPQTLIEQGTGKDWRGQPIVRPNASLPEIASDRMAHLFSKLGPISVKNMVKGTEPGSNISRFETALGFRAPGAYIQDPEGLDRAMKYKGEREWKAKERRERKIELRQSGG